MKKEYMRMKAIELMEKLKTKPVFAVQDIERIGYCNRDYAKQVINRLKERKLIKKIRRIGLQISIELESTEVTTKAMKALLDNGLVSDQFLFMPNAFRIAPPLIITKKEIELTIELIVKSLEIP